MVDLVGQVLECDPPRRLVLTCAFPADAANPARHSRIALEIEPIGDMVRLTVVHEDLELGSDIQKGITDGWPRVLSGLKSLLQRASPGHLGDDALGPLPGLRAADALDAAPRGGHYATGPVQRVTCDATSTAGAAGAGTAGVPR